jgi:hypothetical protein
LGRRIYSNIGNIRTLLDVIDAFLGRRFFFGNAVKKTFKIEYRIFTPEEQSLEQLKYIE